MIGDHSGSFSQRERNFDTPKSSKDPAHEETWYEASQKLNAKLDIQMNKINKGFRHCQIGWPRHLL